MLRNVSTLPSNNDYGFIQSSFLLTDEYQKPTEYKDLCYPFIFIRAVPLLFTNKITSLIKTSMIARPNLISVFLYTVCSSNTKKIVSVPSKLNSVQEQKLYGFYHQEWWQLILLSFLVILNNFYFSVAFLLSVILIIELS